MAMVGRMEGDGCAQRCRGCQSGKPNAVFETRRPRHDRNRPDAAGRGIFSRVCCQTKIGGLRMCVYEVLLNLNRPERVMNTFDARPRTTHVHRSIGRHAEGGGGKRRGDGGGWNSESNGAATRRELGRAANEAVPSPPVVALMQASRAPQRTAQSGTCQTQCMADQSQGTDTEYTAEGSGVNSRRRDHVLWGVPWAVGCVACCGACNELLQHIA